MASIPPLLASSQFPSLDWFFNQVCNFNVISRSPAQFYSLCHSVEFYKSGLGMSRSSLILLRCYESLFCVVCFFPPQFFVKTFF